MGKGKSLQGILQIHPDGYGFVVGEKPDGIDAFIPARAIGDALHRDSVEVILQKGRGDKMEGRIIKILQRGLTQLVGRFEIRGKSAIVVTDDFKVGRTIVIPSKKENGARHNEMVIAKITEYPSGQKSMVGEVIERLGVRGSDEIEVKIIVARHGIPERFPDPVVAEAEKIQKGFQAEAFDVRENLESLPFITIDGETAKDFDDAVCAVRLPDGKIRVWVSIADVSFFVKPGSVVDQEAYRRATSVYLPGYCVPMLPEALSNNICSLIPDEKRFCFTAEMVVAPDGQVSKERFYRSVIRSRYRMTYTEVYRYLEKGEAIDTGPEVLTSLKSCYEAARYCRSMRVKRGSIDFDLPEPQIILDMRGKPSDIIKADRNLAHMLIEDLMILANEAVAEFLTRRGYPCMYRIHDRPNPEKLLELKVLLEHLGHRISVGKDPHPRMLAKVTKAIAGKPEERLINMLLLRSMSQAVYGTKNIGHYGLASNCYCHFTSPIRRYPDLIIHRLLADALGYEKDQKGSHLLGGHKNLASSADHSTKMERRSMEAEREAHSLYTALFMRDKVGEIFSGLISHAAKKGVFVELVDFFVEGMILPEDLTGDRYLFDKKRFAYVGRRQTLQIGDTIKVRVKDVSIEKRQVYFEPA